MNGDSRQAVEPATNAAIQGVLRLWWLRAALALLRAASTVVQFSLLLLTALLCARASSFNNDLWGVLTAGGVYSALSSLRLKLDLGLPGLPEGTPGERALFFVQMVAFGGLAFTLSSHELARWGWAPMAGSAVLHLVLKGGYWTIYSPARQSVGAVKRRLLSSAAVFALAFAWMFLRWFESWHLTPRILGSGVVAYLAAAGVLGMRALTRVLRDGLRGLPDPATAADYAQVEAQMAERARLGAPSIGPRLQDVTAKNAVSAFSRLLFALVLFPLSFLVGVPLPWVYAYVLLRRAPPSRAPEPPPPPPPLGQAPIPWPNLAAVAAAQLLFAGWLAGGAIFGGILLASHQAAWLGSPKLCVFLAVFFGGIAAVLGVLWGAVLTAELVNDQLRTIAMRASGQLVRATAERIGWAQRGLSLKEVEQLILGSVGGIVQPHQARGGVAGIGASLFNWVIRRFVGKTRDAVFAVARRNGRNDVNVWDLELALREGALRAVGDRIDGYLRIARNLVQLGYATLLVPCVVSVAITGAVADAAARASAPASSTCDSSCSYNAGCHLLRNGSGRLPCCEPIRSVSGGGHAAKCRKAQKP